MTPDAKNPQPRSTWLYATVALLVSAAAVAIVWGIPAPVRVTVDGVPKSVSAHSTLGDLRDEGLFHARPGNLLSVKGAVLRPGGGQPALVTRNGRPASMTQRVYDGDAVVSRSGSDRFETTVTVEEPIPQATQQQGDGPVLKLAQPGSPGVRRVERGSVSGIVLSQVIIRPAVDMIVVRTHPSPTDKLVALTFDDGPWNGQTAAILDILKSQNVHATFFMVGGQVKRYPDLAKRVFAEGHLIGNHTLSHELLTKQTPAEIKRQIAVGADTVQRATGFRPVWFRPPYGALDSKVWDVARKLNVHIVLWDIDTSDWRRPGVDRIVRNAESPMHPGAIVLMHDGGSHRDQTIAALPRVIADLRAQGYTFVTLDELAAAK